VRMGCCTSLLYGTPRASKNTVKSVLAPDYHLASAVRSRHGARVCHLNCRDSSDPGTPRVYLGSAFLQVSALRCDYGRRDSPWTEVRISGHIVLRPGPCRTLCRPAACRAGGGTLRGSVSGRLDAAALAGL
jgi:hypothetical protein